MVRHCEILDKSFLSGNKVSHAVNKTRRRFLPNLQSIHLKSNILSKTFKLKLSTQAIRTINFQGGLDEYLTQTHRRFLTKKAQALKKAILLKQVHDKL